jgi:hypothetical protein
MLKTEHTCPYMPKMGVSVLYAYETLGRESWSWCLHVCREATEEDLEQNHHLEGIDDVIWETIIEITHCTD